MIGLTLACVAGLDAMEGPLQHRVMLSAAVALATALSVFSKEMGVTIPIIFLALAAASSSGTGRRLRDAALPFASMATVVAVYVAIREHVAPGLAGPYGRFAEITRLKAVLPSLIGHFREFLFSPMFPASPGTMAIRFLLAALLLLALARALYGDPRRTCLFLAALVFSLAPVIWSIPSAGSTAGGRLRYLPGLFFCALVGLGSAESVGGRTGPARTLGPAAFLLALLALSSQRRLWTHAAMIARRAIDEVAALSPLSGSTYIANLPYAFEEGPYILKSYAFHFYLGERLRGKIRSTAVTYAVRDGILVPVKETLDPFSEYISDPGERTLVLRSPAP